MLETYKLLTELDSVLGKDRYVVTAMLGLQEGTLIFEARELGTARRRSVRIAIERLEAVRDRKVLLEEVCQYFKELTVED